MKKLLFVVVLFKTYAYSADIITYDVNTDRCKAYYASIDENNYIGVPGYLIFTNTTNQTAKDIRTILKTTPVRYLKHVQGNVQIMNQNEMISVDSEQDYLSRKSQKTESSTQYKNDPVIQALIQIIAETKGTTAEIIQLRINELISEKLKLPK